MEYDLSRINTRICGACLAYDRPGLPVVLLSGKSGGRVMIKAAGVLFLLCCGVLSGAQSVTVTELHGMKLVKAESSSKQIWQNGNSFSGNRGLEMERGTIG